MMSYNSPSSKGEGWPGGVDCMRASGVVGPGGRLRMPSHRRREGKSRKTPADWCSPCSACACTALLAGGRGVEIDLGKGLVAVIDDEDADLVAGFKWYAMKAPQREKGFYAAGWKHMPPGRYFVHLHRLI